MRALHMAAIFVAVSLPIVASTAEAKTRHHSYHHVATRAYSPAQPCVSDNSGRQSCQVTQETHQRSRQRVSDNAEMIPHPAGCPSTAFCACGASVRVFGHSVRSLWPASAWYRFPRTSPAPEMVAVRSHHVFVLESQVSGNEWLVIDYNSGGHQSRRHVRNIAGYAIVNPHASASL